ncbi:RICIN domain-containing protein [Streptomyces sp. NPDC049040]|uniref:RICIN domain-containing protein n=1 Tax=Streptomyces sp. NPDC049040 TaxID=3365593 RepID=UPI00371ADBC4
MTSSDSRPGGAPACSPSTGSGRAGRRWRQARMVGAAVAAAFMAGTTGVTHAAADTSYGPIRVLNHAVAQDGKCLDVKSEDIARTPVHARVQAWDCSGVSEQEWSSHPYAQVPTGEFGTLQTLYQIKNLRTGMCLEIKAEGSLVAGVQADVVPCAGGSADTIADQLWEEQPSGRGFVVQTWSAARVNALLCLDLKGNSNDNGTPVQQWTCNGSTAQVFGGSLGS